jgi:hypothetical protein
VGVTNGVLGRSLAAKLQSLSQEFRATQKSYLSQLKHFKDGSSLDDLIGPATGAPSSGGAASSRDEVDTGFTDLQSQHLISMEELANERDEEIRKIVQSVEELVSALFCLRPRCVAVSARVSGCLRRRPCSKNWQQW